MNWPIVPRSIYDERVRELTVAREEIARLTQTIIDMKVTGATVRQATDGKLAAGIRLEPKRPSKIEQALMDNPRTRVNAALRAGNRRWAEDMIAAGKDEDEVIEKLRNWNAVSAALDDDDDDDEAIA